MDLDDDDEENKRMMLGGNKAKFGGTLLKGGAIYTASKPKARTSSSQTQMKFIATE
jgi:hypothetical protein